MDIFLGKVTQQAMNYAIRSGITITAGYAIKQTSRLLKTAEGEQKDELQDLQLRLESKIKIISPAIDMIELISARGNTSLESAVTLTKSLRYEIQSLGQRLAKAAEVEEDMQSRSSKTQDKARHVYELKRIANDIRKLLTRIEDAVPLISLAITASGANLSSNLPTTVSPSRLLQASTFLTAGDSQYGTLGAPAVQIGPIFTLCMYMLFQGHVRPQNEEDIRTSTWKEVIHKADVRLMRVPLRSLYNLDVSGLNDVRLDEYAYQIRVIEDLEDDRVHSFEDDEPQPTPFGDIPLAGIREVLPVHEISKIFYADTGKILNIGTDGETNNPVLLLKRDVNAVPPRRMIDGWEVEDAQPESPSMKTSKSSPQPLKATDVSSDKQVVERSDPWGLPQDLDPEWIAFEVYTEAPDSDDEADPTPTSPPSRQQPSSRGQRASSAEPNLAATLSHLNLSKPSTSSLPTTPQPQQSPSSTLPQHSTPSAPTLPPIRTSLSLLETLLRLLSLQQFQQQPHLSIPDELLTFFLSDSASSTGAAANDNHERRRLREDAKRRVGFDPYDESPIKRHGEEYQYGAAGDGGGSRRGGYRALDDDYDYDDGEGDTSWAATGSLADEGYGTASAFGAGYLETRRKGSGSPQTPSVPGSRGMTNTPPSSAGRRRPPPVSRWSGRLRGERQASNGRAGSSPLARPPSEPRSSENGPEGGSAGDPA